MARLGPGFAPLGAALLLPGCWLSNAEFEERVAQRPDTASDSESPDDSESAPPDSDDTSDPETDTSDTTPQTCADLDLGGRTGEPVSTGSLNGEGNDSQGTCGGIGNDRSFQWTAPRSGCFAFDTVGSVADTVLYLREDDCEGTEIACNADLVTGQAGFEAAYIGHPMVSGETYIVVVDGAAANTGGEFVLNVSEVAALPAHADLGNAQGAIVYSGTTTGRADTLPNANPCPVDSGRDMLLKWTAPTTGNWRIEISAFFDVVLSIHTACNAQGIACTDQLATGGEALSVQANAGTPLWIRIAGYDEGAGAASGEFVVSISRL